MDRLGLIIILLGCIWFSSALMLIFRIHIIIATILFFSLGLFFGIGNILIDWYKFKNKNSQPK